MKIISGYLKNRSIKSPKNIRPCTSNIREAIFNICNLIVEGSTFLDLFSGSGAIGIEAISRGAELSFFIDKSKESIKYIKSNIANLKIEDKSKVIYQDALMFLKKTKMKFDIISIDPPFIIYENNPNLINEILQTISLRNLLNKNGIIFLEEPTYSKRNKEVEHLTLDNLRKYGSAYLVTYFS
ncbi:MAG: Ribosomal RNA small subunit methyltransferase D [Candidatus Anoxychlamydiales bacterium]|nr:Ribosomal RNA small subunit methyltransferase D [Candidatus Anoxychlamydiales bacterium]